MAGHRSRRTRIKVRLNFLAYPVKSSLGVLGRKWGLLVLMNIALGRAERFNELLRHSPGMGKRILAMRLRELENHGFIVRAEDRHAYTRWRLTPKGADVLPVLLTLIHFASKWPEPGMDRRDTKLLGAREFNVVVQSGSASPERRSRTNRSGRSGPR